MWLTELNTVKDSKGFWVGLPTNEMADTKYAATFFELDSMGYFQQEFEWYKIQHTGEQKNVARLHWEM